jgi:hypothetical protein
MRLSHISCEGGKVVAPQVAQELSQSLEDFLRPLLVQLDEQIDKRLVRTFFKTIQVILEFRHRSAGLLLSELGAYLLSPAQAPAGTKRLSNLLRCGKWAYGLIEQFLWQQADQRLNELAEAGEEILAIWDESVLEKAESQKLEGLCAVRSSKASRLKRIKPGFFNPPGGRPIFVPGLNWLGVLIMGYSGPPTLAAMQWWTSRGQRKSDRRTEEEKLLQRCRQSWGQRLLHIWDRGFAGSPWLSLAFKYQVRFVLRWPKGYKLLDAQGVKRLAWHITRGKRSQDQRYVWDARRRCYRKVGLVVRPVTHPDYPDQPLWLVVARPGKPGQAPWYLLTNEPVETLHEAWAMVLAYARRWQVEMTWRYTKSELAMESPRLWFWDNRLKLLLMVTLAYAFLLVLLEPGLHPLRRWLLRYWCHRTGKRSQDVSTPLYRLRSALSRLWLTFPPPPLSFAYENSG